jgi:hypothetical protein
MSKKPQTYMGHPNQEKLRLFLRKLFSEPEPDTIETEVAEFLSQNSLPLHDFPPFERLYSRTILYRAENGFEAMAARWSKDAVSAIHGHPMFAFYYLLEGELLVENYAKEANSGISKINTLTYTPGQYFCMRGKPGVFSNGIHRVTAVQESLSIHVYSDDAMNGDVFTM